MSERLLVTVPDAPPDRPGQPGDRLDRSLASLLPQLSRSRLKALIEGGQVSSGGATLTDPSQRVKPGQTFAILLPEPEAAAPAAQDIPLLVVFEDEHLIVIDKPAGMVVHPAPGNPDNTLVNALLAHCGPSLTGIGGVARPGIVHRLDRDTSGLLVAAKTEPVHQALVRQFAGRTVRRRYLAVVRGVPRGAEGEVSAPIGRSAVDRKKMAVVASGKPAVTRWRRLAAYRDKAALLECRLLTGRTHQIRVHLTHVGHPLLGDPVYGGDRGRRDPVTQAMVARIGRQALHAASLGFRHPATGAELDFERPAPADLAELITSLESL